MPEPRSERPVVVVALVLSLLLHVVLLLAHDWWLAARPPEAEQRDPVPLRFIEQREAEPPTEPPETDVISEVDAAAQAPEPLPQEPDPVPQPRVAGRVPVPATPRTPPPSPPVERQPEVAPPEPPPEEAEPDEPDPPLDPAAEKRRRVAEALDALRPSRPLGDLSDLVDTPLPSIPDGAWSPGDVQFESRADVDWGPYSRRLQRIVRSNWRIPNAAKVGLDGVVQVHFFITRSGAVEELEVVRQSGSVPLDVAARDAIALSDAFPPPPLPADSDEERVGVTWTFFYNIDDGEMRLWRREERLRRMR